MNRINYFENVLKRCEDFLNEDPQQMPMAWIIEQLKYLIKLEKGNEMDISRLTKIKIGWIAAREMDGCSDKELIHSICVVANEVEKMIFEKGLSI